MSGDPGLPVTGGASLVVGGVVISTSNLALIGVAIALVGTLLVLATIRKGWRRGRGAHQS